MMKVFQQINTKKHEDQIHNKAIIKAQRRLTGIFKVSFFCLIY